MFRKIAIVLAASTVVAMPLAAQSPTADAEFMAKLRDALNRNPELVVGALQQAQARQEAQQQERMQQAVAQFRPRLEARPAIGPVLGNPNGQLTVVEFLDYNCGFCKRAHGDVNTLVSRRNDVRVVNIMRPILGPDSVVLARFALAASLQGKFKEANDALFTAEGRVATTPDSLAGLAQRIGLDWARAQRDMNGAEVNAILDRHTAISEEMQVTGTPFFVTPGGVIPGAADAARLEAGLGSQRAAR